MATVKAHYDELLADIYTWMLGDFDGRVAADREWLRGAVPAADDPSGRPCAIDLGAGPGVHALALAGLGYHVVAVDTSSRLLAEARARATEARLAQHVEVVEADLVAFLQASGEPASAVVCLGDTLTHLDSPATVQQMFAAARRRIAPGGKLVVTYRDLSIERRGLDRIFLVRADATRIMTCFLEFEPARTVVHDIVHARTDAGWEMRTSSYPKLRLPADAVSAWLIQAGFAEVERVPCPGGLIGFVARSRHPPG